MFELMGAMNVLSLFDLYVSLAGGKLRPHDGAKILCLIEQKEEIIVVVRKESGLTLVLNKPGPDDWERPIINCEDGYYQRAESYAEHYSRMVGGPPEHRCFHWQPGGSVYEREPAALLAEDW